MALQKARRVVSVDWMLHLHLLPTLLAKKDTKKTEFVNTMTESPKRPNHFANISQCIRACIQPTNTNRHPPNGNHAS